MSPVHEIALSLLAAKSERGNPLNESPLSVLRTYFATSVPMARKTFGKILFGSSLGQQEFSSNALSLLKLPEITCKSVPPSLGFIFNHLRCIPHNEPLTSF